MLKEMLGQIQAKLAIKTAVTAGLAWYVGMQFSLLTDRPDSLISGLWCTLAAIVVVQAYLGGTYQAAWVRFLGVVAGSLLGGLGTTLLGANPVSLAGCVFLTVIICSIVNIKESIRIACMSTSVVMILWGLRPEMSPWIFTLFRIIDSTLGILVAMVVVHLIFPSQATATIRTNMSNILIYCEQLMRLLTRDDTHADETQVRYHTLVADIRLLRRQNQNFLNEAKMELLTRPSQLEVWISLHEDIGSLFNSIVSLTRVYPESKKMFDSTLENNLKQVIEQIEESLQELANALVLNRPIPPHHKLLAALDQLQHDRTRFRNTYTTRKFELSDVENFFVSFYSLENIISQLSKLNSSFSELVKSENE